MATTLQDIVQGFDILASGDGTGLQAKQPRELAAGGPGSGCHGSNCGRHGGGKGTDKTHVPKSATVGVPRDKIAQQGIRDIGRKAAGIAKLAQRAGNKQLEKLATKIAEHAKAGNVKGVEKAGTQLSKHAERHNEKSWRKSDDANFTDDRKKAEQLGREAAKHSALADAIDELDDDIRFGWGQ